jgi:hypothetical protein
MFKKKETKIPVKAPVKPIVQPKVIEKVIVKKPEPIIIKKPVCLNCNGTKRNPLDTEDICPVCKGIAK